MTALEIVEKVKKSGSAENIEADSLYIALKSLERRIRERAEVPESEFNKDSVLYACGGGIAEGYEDMYSAYLNREACRIREDWDCYGNYDALFLERYKDLCKEIIRKRTPKRFSFR